MQNEGKVTRLEVEKCVTVYKEDGKKSLDVDPEQKTTIEADTIIPATVQECDLSGIENLVETGKGIISADPLTLETSKEGIFAGGDVVLGPSSLVESVAQGHRAAESIARYIDGENLRTDREPVMNTKEYADIPENANKEKIDRTKASMPDPQERSQSFVEIEETFTKEDAVREAKRCLQCASCAECMECVRTRKANTVDHNQKDKQQQFKVGAIIATGGFKPFDASKKPEYGYGIFPNVITSIQFERILSASGPYEGHVKRPYDGKKPKKIAWIQCVGSRDVTTGNDYCSSVCCMYAIKEAMVAKDHDPEIEPTIFYIDIRAFGKDFENFYNQAKYEAGVQFVRSQISSVKENLFTKDLQLNFIKDGNYAEEEFDMVVLSVDMTAHPSNKTLSDILDIPRNKFGFFEEKQLQPLETSKEGIYLCGTGNGPKDIPETVMQGSAAAALCSEMLRSVRNMEASVKEYPTEKQVSGEDPRIGVFVCHCGINISSVVNVEEVAEYLKKLPGVVHAEHTLYTCSQDTQKRMKELIQDKNLNRVIVASCTPRTHEALFQEILREAGLNKYLFEMTDIREQCSWVHQNEPELATQKAESLAKGSVGKSTFQEPLSLKTISINKEALIIGGGISGMTSALSLANQGFKVHLTEKNDALGGNLAYLNRELDGEDWQTFLKNKIKKVNDHELINIYLNTNINSVDGSIGNFTSHLSGAYNDEIRHGVTIVATGAEEYKPNNFLYGEKENIMTQRDLEFEIEKKEKFGTVVMIQCVGSRDDQHKYCSRVCCSEAIKNSIYIKEKDPEADVYILYRDLRTYTYREVFYRKARELGVKFIHFPDEEYPEVTEENNKLNVRVNDTVIKNYVTIKPDLLILSSGIVANNDINQHISELMKLPLDEHVNFMEAHAKLRPVDFASEGIFVCGLAHSPKNTEENITQALAAAGRAATILSKDSLEVGGVVSVIEEEKCASCLTCLRECIFDAPFIKVNGKTEIEPAKCQGCGNCASACPAGAIQLLTFTDTQEEALYGNILEETQPK